MNTRNISIAIRAHTELSDKQENKPPGHVKKEKKDLQRSYGKRVIVIDTETTTDIYQNLLFGQAMIFEGTNQARIDGLVSEHYLFYGDCLSDNDMVILKQFAKDQGAILLSRQEFINEVFWPEVWELGTLCVGFNLPFDLSRLAIAARTFQSGKHRDMFELKLSESNYKPTILIKPIDSKKAFIELRFPTRPKRGSKRIPFKQGRFLDLKTLVFALTNESHSLASACKLYQVEHGKGHAEEHGKITFDYVRYNEQDVEATLELYCKVKEEFDRHPITLEAGKAYSPATIGKAYYKAMGVKPFHEKQPDFPKEIYGYAMASYYGGRSECHYRNKPVKVFHTDITSMYPSVFTLQNLWSWVIADRLNVMEATEEVKNFIDNITLDNLFIMETWLNVHGLVQVMPKDDLLPVRAEYGKKNGYQIGLNHLTTVKPMWYTLADVIACKILTGKNPEILRAIRIVPGVPQEGLTPVHIRREIPIDPAKDNFFKKIIELRKQVKKEVKQDGDESDAMQLFLKILANSTSYGVYIEMNREEFEEEKEIEVFGLESFPFKHKHIDINGRYYNPLIAVMITGAARLILAMMEKTVCDLGGNFTFCDTDSMSIMDLKNDRPDEIGWKIVKKFESLIPYAFGGSLLEAEDYNWERIDWNNDTEKENVKKGEYYPLYCYMVSAKRYVLYNLIPDGKGGRQIVIRKKSDHGLGHLKTPIKSKYKNEWVNVVWKWILSREHGLPYQEAEWFYFPAFAQLSISKPSLYDILNRDKSKDYSIQVKPFNFILVAYSLEDKLFGKHVITRYYCKLYKAIGLGLCKNKSKCKYAPNCYANLHIIPITPYNDPNNWREFKWLDKNTKTSLNIQLNNNKSDEFKIKQAEKIIDSVYPDCSEKERKKLIKNHIVNLESDVDLTQNAIINDTVFVKNYFDFIQIYNLHPELKYDDLQGNPCGRMTKGLLQRTHIKATEIIHIGKETNTLQDKEEEAIIPDEQNWDDTILTYDENRKDKKNYKIDIEQWYELLVLLKEKAKPRKAWAKKLGISLVYFKQILAKKRLPSSELYKKIISQCNEGNITIPEGKKPIPSSFENNVKDCIYPINELALKNGMPVDKIKKILNENIFTLNNTGYVNLNTDFAKKVIGDWRKFKQQKNKEEEAKALAELKVFGISLTERNHELKSFDISDITHVQVSHEVGRSYKTLNVRIRDGNIYKVLKKDNPLIFKYGLLPKVSEISFNLDYTKSNNGFITKYGPWLPYEGISWLNENLLLGLFGISKNILQIDLESGKLPGNKIKYAENGKLLVNSLAVFKTYGKQLYSKEEK